VAAGNTSPVSITGKFADPDTGEARRVTTTLGSFDIILYPLATPGTVNNFLRYADDGLYNSTFFHRSIDDFIVQGGGYSHNGTSFSKVVAFPAIQNEPGISNVAGTVAMAKIGGQPNSATSEFFVNLNDLNAHDPNNPNGANLDEQNEGFSVFGRIAGTGMNVVNQINALPSQDYTVTVDGSSRRLDDVPMNVAPPVPAVMDPTKLVKVTSVAPVPILRYEVTSGDPAIATAVVNGTNVDITGVATGTTTITVKAIDLDGQMVSQTIPLTVP
jgi:cyclophilin family peptidyl-prolyl cis-trans isomerase